MRLVDEHAGEDALIAVAALGDAEVNGLVLTVLGEGHNVAPSADDLRLAGLQVILKHK